MNKLFLSLALKRSALRNISLNRILYSTTKFNFTHKRKYFKKSVEEKEEIIIETQEQTKESESHNDYTLDIDTNTKYIPAPNHQTYKNGLSYFKFKEGELIILKETAEQAKMFYGSIALYISLLLLSLWVIRNNLKNKEKKRWRRYLYISLSIGAIFLIAMRSVYKITLSKILVKRVSLLSDGKRLKIGLYFPKEITVDISKFRKISKTELFTFLLTYLKLQLTKAI